MATADDVHNLYEDIDYVTELARMRPKYPDKLTDVMVEYLKRKHPGPYKHCADVGCGSGNGTRMLIGQFDHVTGCDVSETQLTVARNMNKELGIDDNGTSYRLGSAENLPFDDKSIDLLVCSLSLHFFDLEKFYKELDRVLTPGGCLASYGFAEILLKHDGKIVNFDPILEEMRSVYKEAKSSFPGLQMIFDKYTKVDWPYKEVERFEDIMGEHEVAVGWFERYLCTRLAHQTYIRKTSKEQGKAAMETMKDNLRKLLNITDTSDDYRFKIVLPMFVVMCRKPLE